MSPKLEKTCLNAAPRPLKDIAAPILDTGFRLGEALALQWRDVRLKPANGASRGYVRVVDGTLHFARRNVPLTERARRMLETRQRGAIAPWVFAGESGKSLTVFAVDEGHQKLHETPKMSGEFVLHSLRHTYGTRLGEAGADAFTIIRLRWRSTVMVSQRYLRPTPESLERTVDKLEVLNATSTRSLPVAPKLPEAPTISHTQRNRVPVGH